MEMIDREKVIKGLDSCAKWMERNDGDACNNCPYHSCFSYDDNNCIATVNREAISLLKEQEPKVPIHIHEEYPEHDWEKDKDGNIDEFAMDYGFHNGPACKRCGYSFCMHCKPNGWNEKPCVIDYYQCPRCGTHIIKNNRKIQYCEKCGQAVEWNV